VVFPPGLIATLLESRNVHQCDMVAPKIMYHQPSDKIWWAGGYFQPALGYRAAHSGLDQVDVGQFNEAKPVSYSPTCCVLIKKTVFASIGMMDGRYFVYFDDTDFMLRAHKARLVLFYEPSALLHHKVSSLSGGTDSPFAVHFLARNRVYFWVKHLGVPLACIYTASLSALYLVKYLLRLTSGSTLKIQLNAMADGLQLK
jgi:GT2 family glycosyltransferase